MYLLIYPIIGMFIFWVIEYPKSSSLDKQPKYGVSLMYYSTVVNLELQSLLHLSTSVVFQSWGLHVTPWRIDSLHMWGRELFQLSFGVLNFHLRPQGRSGHPVFRGQSKRASLVNYFGPLTLSNGVLSLKKCPK